MNEDWIRTLLDLGPLAADAPSELKLRIRIINATAKHRIPILSKEKQTEILNVDGKIRPKKEFRAETCSKGQVRFS